MKNLSYFGTGGTCDGLFTPYSTEELARDMRYISDSKLPVFFLGGGTNSLVSDEHWPGAVVSFANLNKIEFDRSTATCGSGVDNSIFSSACSDLSLGGAAWMYRLPGQLGGTVRMNARCYGGEISEIVSKVVAVDRLGNIHSYQGGKRVFRGYKDTIFIDNNQAVAEVVLELHPDDKLLIEQKMRTCESDRVSKGQFLFPSCGCVFKNNYQVGIPSGQLLDASGAKSLIVGRASVSPEHANFVFNQGASSREILELTFAMREVVYQNFGVWLEYEMEVLGIIPEDLQKILSQKKVANFRQDKLDALRSKFNQTQNLKV